MGLNFLTYGFINNNPLKFKNYIYNSDYFINITLLGNGFLHSHV